MAKKPIALIIMDGFGINPNTEGNAIAAAKKPNLDKFMATYPHTQLSASGLDPTVRWVTARSATPT